MARTRKPKTPAERSRKALIQSSWNVYLARPTLGDVSDRLVEVAGGQEQAYARTRELNATLPPTDQVPCDFYYACHGWDVLPGMARIDRQLDAEAEAREPDQEAE